MKNKLDIEINLYQEKGRKAFNLGEKIKGFFRIECKNIFMISFKYKTNAFSAFQQL